MQRAGRLTLLLLLLVAPACRNFAPDRRDAAVKDAAVVAVADENEFRDEEDPEPDDPRRGLGAGATEPVPGVTESPATRTLVKAVQSRLVAIGFAPGYPDGALGVRTRAALKEFQRAHGLPETGDADTATLESLFGRSESTAPDGEIQRTRGEDGIGTTPPGRPRMSRIRSFGFGAGVGFLCAAAIAVMGFANRRRK